ncbi:MAG: cadherin repeat domain-containing protein [Pirellulaceae bacterium]
MNRTTIPAPNRPAKTICTWPDGTWNDIYGTATWQASVVQWDADAVLDSSQALTYSIQSQTVAGAFAIDSDTGEITVADGLLLDFETNATHTVIVRTTDADSNTVDQAFTISLTDLVEANNSPSNLSSGIELNTDGGNDAYLLEAMRCLIRWFTGTNARDNNRNACRSNGRTFVLYANATADNEIMLWLNGTGTLQLEIDARTQVYGIRYLPVELADGLPHTLSAWTWD